MVTPWDMQRRLFRFMKAQETPMTLVSIQDVRTFGAQEATGATDHTYYFEFAVGGGRYKMRVDHSDIALLKYEGGRAERGPCLLTAEEPEDRILRIPYSGEDPLRGADLDLMTGERLPRGSRRGPEHFAPSEETPPRPTCVLSQSLMIHTAADNAHDAHNAQRHAWNAQRHEINDRSATQGACAAVRRQAQIEEVD